LHSYGVLQFVHGLSTATGYKGYGPEQGEKVSWSLFEQLYHFFLIRTDHKMKFSYKIETILSFCAGV